MALREEDRLDFVDGNRLCRMPSGLITKFAMTPIYSSTAQLYVVVRGGLSQLTDLTMGTQLTQDYMVIVKPRPVPEQVIADPEA